MKEDQLESLLKDSIVKTSDGFTDQMMGRLVSKQMKQIRIRLYILIVSVISSIGIGAFLINRFGVKLSAFGFSLELPKTAPLVMIGFMGLLVVLHLTHLVRLSADSES